MLKHDLFQFTTSLNDYFLYWQNSFLKSKPRFTVLPVTEN